MARPKGIPSHRKGVSLDTEYGKERSIDIKCKMSIKKLNHIPWNKDKKGIMPIPWNKGKTSNVIIECDGDYWHRKPKMIERDKRQNKWFEESDYILLRFWESNINNNFSDVANRISNEL